MYDFATEVPKRNSKLKTLDIKTIPDLCDLSTPEVSFDLQNYIAGQNQGLNNQTDNLLADLLDQQRLSPAYGFPMPQSAGFGSDRYGSEAGVKQEPASAPDTYGPGYGYSGLPQLPDTINSAGYSSASSYKDEKKKKNLDKASDEYKRRRERNNIAVRKSREKAKQRCKDTERRVTDLVSENDKLRKRVELLSKELSVLKNLLANVGVQQNPK
ncbi:hypothetical protein JTE90_012416 [Oedothorax gibbosus]|uniref:BZIP domain-containing protein n=1 Tax=Oedothorax gibbosus TaxID=931172 RepID=A0AAV6TW21_9ARAC|nr:hypothetical protein JTE90_012416 [Oedothorax gibbosus]